MIAIILASTTALNLPIFRVGRLYTPPSPFAIAESGLLPTRTSSRASVANPPTSPTSSTFAVASTEHSRTTRRRTAPSMSIELELDVESEWLERTMVALEELRVPAAPRHATTRRVGVAPSMFMRPAPGIESEWLAHTMVALEEAPAPTAVRMGMGATTVEDEWLMATLQAMAFDPPVLSQ